MMFNCLLARHDKARVKAAVKEVREDVRILSQMVSALATDKNNVTSGILGVSQTESDSDDSDFESIRDSLSWLKISSEEDN
jgi:NADH:ubiquinone oxidoreductase subunit D